MTRDEAIKVLRHTLFKDDKIPKDLQELNEPCAGGWIDAFVALGILKLDKPKTIEQRLDAAVRANLYAETAYSRDVVYIRPDYLMEVIARAGLRIVEK